MNSTSVETQTFYFTATSGHYGLAQIIYNDVGGLRKTCQLTTKLFYPERSKPFLWSSDSLSNWKFDKEKTSFHAESCDVTLSPDGNSYHIKSSVSKKAIIDLTFTRTAPGVMAGRNGTTTYGTDLAKPWGSMRHAYWPRCSVTGSIVTPSSGAIDLSGRGMFVHALQGMRPNLAAATHNFCNFQSPKYSAVMWEFTTPPSYGSTSVAVGAVATEGKIITGGAKCKPEHTAVKGDKEIGWPEPSAATFRWEANGGGASAEVSAQLGERIDRIDVLQEVPGFVKAIMAQAGGLKPYIYQFQTKATIKVTGADGQVDQEEGTMLMEATYISGLSSGDKASKS